MNMSYCRFQNTLIDLRVCLDILCYRESEEPLSADEFAACREMLEAFIDFCYGEGILKGNYDDIEDTQERLEEYLQGIKTEE